MANRTILLKRTNLMAKIKENKEAHIKDYEEAVIAYRKEAAEQLENQRKALEEGKLDIKLNLVEPVNKAEEYDKTWEMFDWEIKEDIELSQQEFREYVQDEAPSTIHSKVMNATYKAKFFE